MQHECPDQETLMDDSHMLSMNEDTMRAAGQRALDLIISHLLKVRDEPVIRKRSRKELDALLDRQLPETPGDFEPVIREIEQKVFPNILHLDHPRCFAFVPGPGNFASVLGDLLASGFNVFNGIWLEASGAAEVELTVIDWLRQAVGYPSSGGGLFVSGGSQANMTAMCAAREKLLGELFSRGTVYFSDQTHSSVKKALRILGVPSANARILPSSEAFTLDVDALERAVLRDRAEGFMPFLVIGNAGTTNTGAVDPLGDISVLCEREGLWFHVDGAIGASTVLCERGKSLLQGIERADSITLDPHKWLFQPYEMGCLLVKNREDLIHAFHSHPEYLQDAKSSMDEPNLADYGMQLTRNFKALKLWLTFKIFGRRALSAALEWGFHLAEFTADEVRKRGDLELRSGPAMGIVCFRYIPRDIGREGEAGVEIDLLQREIVNALIRDGFAMLTTTVIGGVTVLRMCMINPRTTHEDVLQTLDLLCRLGRAIVHDMKG
jgi:glutamate/tyrosine decarboxylase-like PLP-dependent enzyme